MHGFKQFFLPRLRGAFLRRAVVVALFAFLWFRLAMVPAWVSGGSMEPTYRDGTLLFYLPWLPRLRPPRSGEVVMVRMTGRRVMLLKRIVAMPGDTVEFRGGWLYVNGQRREEPYVRRRYNWELEAREVQSGHVYVVGDNRGMPMQRHDFGQTEKERIIGYPLW